MIASPSPLRHAAALLLGAAFVAVGITHFTHAWFFEPIVPPLLPAGPAVFWSGVFEVLGGLGVLVPATRRWAGWGLMLLVLAVFPANLYSALYQVAPGGLEPSPVGLWLRLPFQFLFWAWIWWAAVRWPLPNIRSARSP
jgi:uncharacterized membrane protein